MPATLTFRIIVLIVQILYPLTEPIKVMKIKFLFATLIGLSLSSITARAQQGDPWILQAYRELYNRQPTAAELNINNYNRGSWSNYAELKNYVSKYQSSKGSPLQGDPWIFQIYNELYNRNPNALEVNIKNYNGGSWGNYADLKNHVQEFQSSLLQAGITISTAFVNNVAIVGFNQNGQQIAVAALSLNGGQIVANDGATIVSGGAGNIVSGGAGNLIGQDGAGIIINSAMGGISFGNSYTILSENTRVVKSGKGSLIIRK